MKKSIDFSKGIRGKHAQMNLGIIGAVESVWAVCVSRKDSNLILFKLYKIEMSPNSEKVKVKNEEGVTEFYPKSWFAPLTISKSIIGLLESAV